MQTQHKIIFGSSQRMPELVDGSVQLMVTSPPYPMIQMWDSIFIDEDPRIGALWRKLEEDGEDEAIAQIYDAMHIYLAPVWQETYRVLVDGGIACINIGDATRTINGKFKLFPNHARILEICEKIGFTTLPYILWKKPTTKPKYKGKGAFLGSGFLPPNAYVTIDCEFILLFRKGNLRKFPPKDPHTIRQRFHEASTRRMVQPNLVSKGHPANRKRTRETNSSIPRRNRRSANQDVQHQRRHGTRPFLGFGNHNKRRHAKRA